MITLPRIYPITDTRISGLTHAEQLRRLIDGGATLVQLRDKAATSGEFLAAAAEAVSVARKAGIAILINDRADIALAVGADGVHLGQDDLPPEQARELLGNDAIIGYSTHSIEQARNAVDLPVDYIAVGPIFTTTTKADPDPVLGLDLLREISSIASYRGVVAIGGIDRTNAASVLAAGADSVAVISDLISAPSEIPARMREFLELRR